MGRFILVVGPSGAGKDTLIGLIKRELAEDDRFVFPRRLITRPKSAWEDHDTITPEEFERDEAGGRFCLSWRAHGLRYGIPRNALEAVRLDRIVICNASRNIIEEARGCIPGIFVVEVTAPPEVLEMRLVARGREHDEDIKHRIRRSHELRTVKADLTIVNDGPIEESVNELLSFLRVESGNVPQRLSSLSSA